MRRKSRKKKNDGFLIPKIDFPIDFNNDGEEVDGLEYFIFDRMAVVKAILEELDENDMMDTEIHRQYENELYLLMALDNIHEENLKHEE